MNADKLTLHKINLLTGRPVFGHETEPDVLYVRNADIIGILDSEQNGQIDDRAGDEERESRNVDGGEKVGHGFDLTSLPAQAPDWFVTAVADEARKMSSNSATIAQAAWNALLRASVAPPSA